MGLKNVLGDWALGSLVTIPGLRCTQRKDFPLSFQHTERGEQSQIVALRRNWLRWGRGGGKEPSEPVAWDLGDIASAERKRSNDHELGRQSHSKKLKEF